MKLAVRYGAITANPVREVDLRDLTAFMLGTGVRIGEALAVLWHQIDLEAGTVQITWPQTRIELIETGRIKVDYDMITTLVATYGIRLDHHHPLLAQLHDATHPPNPTSLPGSAPTPSAKLPPPPSTKPATPPAKIADQLGQAKVSITQDVYMGRQAAQSSRRPGAVNGWRATGIDTEAEAREVAFDLEAQYDAHGPRPVDAIRKVDPAVPVLRASWTTGELYIWIRDQGTWLGRFRDEAGRVDRVPGKDLRPL
jgi:hypothetical protein